VATVGLTVKLLPVAPVDQTTLPVAQALAVKVVEPPLQIDELLPLATNILGAIGVVVTVTVATSEAALIQLSLLFTEVLQVTV
jgi:hypothetical protein